MAILLFDSLVPLRMAIRSLCSKLKCLYVFVIKAPGAFAPKCCVKILKPTTSTPASTATAGQTATPSGILEILKHMPYHNPIVVKDNGVMIYALLADVPDMLGPRIYTTAARLIRTVYVNSRHPVILSLAADDKGGHQLCLQYSLRSDG